MVAATVTSVNKAGGPPQKVNTPLPVVCVSKSR
jgi:hypothetical protein